jgi:rare lipoprotein A (peptidoglycan hydrolase)
MLGAAVNNPNALTAGSGMFPIGTMVKVTNPDTNTSVTVRINDKSSFCVAMSQAAFAKVRNPGKNLIPNAKVQVVGKAGK